MTEQIKQYTELVKSLMGKKRFTHSVNVADMCFKLATIHGEDSVKAYTAGILHDIHKEIDPELMKREVLASGMNVDPVELDTQKLWHGIAGAYFCKTELKIDDEDIINAIRYHTVGRANMSKLEKIVYLGDLVSMERDYPEVEKFRKFTMEDLDNAMFEAMKWSIPNTIGKGGKIPLCSMECYNYYWQYRK